MIYPIPVYPRPKLLRDTLLLSVLVVVLLLDQFSKQLVQRYLELGEALPDDAPLRLIHVTNSGGAFGIFPNQTAFLTVASFVGIAVLILFYRSQPWPGRLVRLSLGLQLGGAMGNLLDRLRQGEVVDFIDIGPWPIFNLADSSIVIGIFLLAGLFLFSGHWSPPVLQGLPAPRDPPVWPPPEVGC